MTTAKDVRATFLKYFEDRGHRVVRSSSLVPGNDPTLLFANAGMNQFKNIFLGRETRDYRRACSTQKCVRAGGKHNDLENVGHTPRHHTFFEMLGNFSFGDYFKEDAIAFAWELCTQVYGIEASRLHPTVFREDDEAAGLWRRVTGLPDGRILRLGEKDNFWAMGDTGPCGPCSEILVDLGVSPAGHADCPPDCECGRYLEIWNLVFMQYNRDETGTTTPLPAPSIDTGMGLERITSVLQGKLSNYDTDLFLPIIREAEAIAGVRYGQDPKSDVSLRIIADHSRSGAFLVSDGVVPSNEGRGYVLRKILRRAIRHGKMLGVKDPFLHRLTTFTADLMGDPFDELTAARPYVERVIRVEEEQFSTTLDFGLSKLEDAARASGGALSGAEVFRLYDTYGFPLDILREIAEEKGLTLDLDGFQAELEQQKERARASWKGEAHKVLAEDVRKLTATPARFEGYDTLLVPDARVEAILVGDARIDQLAEGAEGEVFLDRTPFYAESGGQVGDQGFLRGEKVSARVLDTHAPAAGVTLHRVKVLHGTLVPGETLHAEVDERRRFFTACNHTATHLLHAALREVLGPHVKQAGSLVAPDRFRFDFSHFTAVTPAELEAIEERVNQSVWANHPVRTDLMNVDQAVESGAMALFGEKYQETVRVVSVEGVSRELCGGTHLSRTGSMGIFRIASEGGIAAGVRRIEGMTGIEGYRRSVSADRTLDAIRQVCVADNEKLPAAVAELQEATRRQQKEIDRLRLINASRSLESIVGAAVDVDGTWAVSGVLEDVDRPALRTLADQLLKRFGNAVVALGAEIEGKAALVVMTTPEVGKVHPAGKIVGGLAARVGGGGGGRPTLAEAGGKDPARLAEAMAALPGLLKG
ncbi:MAG: alanine--tRNA ligase [Acidobacteria bacterium]|nr:alanine--tRNA ligase [Acidobacteriota bacterium]